LYGDPAEGLEICRLTEADDPDSSHSSYWRYVKARLEMERGTGLGRPKSCP
jgi:hypothetical protein